MEMERVESVVVDGQPEFNDDIPVVAQQKTGKMSILMVSDIHLAFERLQMLVNWHFENGRKRFDCILASGDFANISHDESDGYKLEKSEEDQAEKDISKVLEILESFNAPIFYIPGNHDPKSLFLPEQSRPVLSSDSTNLHKDWILLKPNLALVALGGSTASYYQKAGETEMTPVYFPYPYGDDNDFKKDFQPVFDSIQASQIIIMTHDGPWGSTTALDKKQKEGRIHFGSKYLAQLLENNENKIIANIHGHCHDGSAIDKVSSGNLRILNPGSLMLGEFAELTLKETADGSWKILQFNKHFLD